MNAIIRNPFDTGGYSLAEMTQAINILPNLYTRLGEIGLAATGRCEKSNARMP